MCIEPSLIELLAIRLSPQAGKSLVIPRRRESSGFEPKAFLDGWIPACAGMTKQRGISLIELVMFIIIISIAVTGVLLVMNRVTGHSADTLVRKQSLAIAESLLEEIELQDFVSASGVTNAVTQANRATAYHIVSDYNGFATAGIFAVDGVAPIAGLGSYNVLATTVVPTALGNIAVSSAVLITVTVSDPTGQQTIATGYRVAY